MSRVKNINGTSKNKCRCGSWIKHWEKFAKRKRGRCSEIKCRRTDVEGAHIQRAYSKKKYWYIIPLCSEHNKKIKGSLEVRPKTVFISANKKETCEKT